MKTRAYYYNPSENTLTITKAFAEKLQNPNSDESAIYRAIKADNPTIKVCQRTHKTKAGYKNQYDKLTYKHMEAYMNLFPNADELLEEYNKLRDCANLFSKSPYKKVREWFVAQFPKYRDNPMFHLTEKLTIIPADKYLEEVKKAS